LKIAIVGLGGVGGYIGGKLAKSRENITFIARGKQLEAIEQNGLKVIDNEDEFIVRPTLLTENPKDIVFDVIFICLKSYDYNSLGFLQKNIDKDTIVIPLSNGVNNPEELKKYLNGNILNGCIYILSNIKEAGVIYRYSNTFYLLFGSSESDKAKELEKILNRAGLKSKLSSSIDYNVWKKYLFISTFASLTSYHKASIGYVVESKLDEVKLYLKELKSLADKLKIGLNESDFENVITQAKNIPYDSTTSMQLDFKASRRSEVDNLTGFIVKKSKEFDLKTPFIEKIYQELRCR